MTFLQTKKIKLVRFDESFINNKYICWLNDQDVNKFMCTGRVPVKIEEVQDRSDSCNLMFAIMCKCVCGDDSDILNGNELGFNEYIGTISLNQIDWINRKGEIGYMIGDKNYWGQGVASDAVRLISDYGLIRLNLNKVEAGVCDGNIGSIKVLEKNKFKKYCSIPQDWWNDGEYKRTHRFYKLQKWVKYEF